MSAELYLLQPDGSLLRATVQVAPANDDWNDATPTATEHPVIWADDWKPPPMHWLIKNILARGEIGIIFGASQAGKTFAVLDMAASIARGVEWCGRKVEQTTVLYVAAEGVAGLRKRLDAYQIEHACVLGKPTFAVMPAAPNLRDKGEAQVIGDKALSIGAGLVVIDTLSAVTPGANENTGEGIGPALNHCKLIHQISGAMVLLVHHSGKDESKGARGWTGIKAAADTQLEVKRKGDIRQLMLDKCRDERDHFGYTFRLAVVPVGLDDDGEAVTSCVVEWSDTPVPGSAFDDKETHDQRMLDEFTAWSTGPFTAKSVEENRTSIWSFKVTQRDARKWVTAMRSRGCFMNSRERTNGGGYKLILAPKSDQILAMSRQFINSFTEG